MCWGTHLPELDLKASQIPENFRFAEDFTVLNSGVCSIVGQQIGCWGIHEMDLTHLNNVTELASQGDTACVINGYEVACWREGEFLSEGPTLTNPKNLRFESDTVCVDDEDVPICW